jgi:hypothetical protein
MRLPGWLTILKRLCEVEVMTRDLDSRIEKLESINVVEVASNVVKDKLGEFSKRAIPCARCGSMVSPHVRDTGPRLMTRPNADGTPDHAIGCYECIPYMKRDGWRVVKPEADTPAPAAAPLKLVPPVVEETPA